MADQLALQHLTSNQRQPAADGSTNRDRTAHSRNALCLHLDEYRDAACDLSGIRSGWFVHDHGNVWSLRQFACICYGRFRAWSL